MKIVFKVKSLNGFAVFQLDDKKTESLTTNLKQRFKNYFEIGYFQTDEKLKEAVSDNMKLTAEEIVSLGDHSEQLIECKTEKQADRLISEMIEGLEFVKLKADKLNLLLTTE